VAAGSPAATASDDPHHARRWLILVVLGMAQLLVVLDATIVNIALPSAQDSLGFSDADRQWIVTAYALSFGSLLLIGGRIGDLFGRKRVFVAGLIGFAVASALGGLAGSFELLVAARALQGVFGALLAPAALSLLTTTFTDPRERNTAFGVFGAIAGAGAGVGLLMGGVLTEYLSWRWCLYVNLAFALPSAAGAAALLHHRPALSRPRLDIPGTVSVSLGLFALVYGFSEAEKAGWGAGSTVGFLVAAVGLLGVFAWLQGRSPHPLLPPRLVADRNRAGAFLAMLLVAIGMFAVFLFLTYYLQQTLGYSPVESGLAFLPMVGGIMISSTLAQTVLLARVGPRPLVVGGMLLAAAGMVLLTRIGVGSSYATTILPALVLMSLGLGNVFAPAMSTATLGVAPGDAGVASALVNTSQQVGGSVGTALLNTLATSAVTSYLAGGPQTPGRVTEAALHGYTTAFWWAAAVFAVGAVVSAFVFRSGVAEQTPGVEPLFAH
jgi:EmrB/QacA subfamily drug resistance transporter